MGCSVRELQERFSSKEITEWQAYDRLEPFGIQALNYNFGMLAAMLYNIHRKKNAKMLKAEDFALGDFGKTERETVVLTPDELVKTLASALGAKSRSKKKGKA